MIPTETVKSPSVDEHSHGQESRYIKTNMMQTEFPKLQVTPPSAEEVDTESSDGTHVSDSSQHQQKEMAVDDDSTTTLATKTPSSKHAISKATGPSACQPEDTHDATAVDSLAVPVLVHSSTPPSSAPSNSMNQVSNKNSDQFSISSHSTTDRQNGGEMTPKKLTQATSIDEARALNHFYNDREVARVKGSSKALEVALPPRPPRVLRPKSSCGLENVPRQRRNIVKREGSVFSLMVAGESGLGKTTFVNTLFGDQLMGQRKTGTSDRTSAIEIHKAKYEDINGFSVDFTVIDTPGFGDYINNEFACLPLRTYIDTQHRLYMLSDEQPVRHQKKDTRVHVCLYFLRPSGRGLVELDIRVLTELSSRVNLIPVIAKADSFTPAELEYNKQLIRQAIIDNNIRVYCPNMDENPANVAIYETILQKEGVPYAVICSNDLTGRTKQQKENIDGMVQTVNVNIRGRAYDGGTAEVENSEHCDFEKLLRVLMKESMLHLIDTTVNIHYENYRREFTKIRLESIQNIMTSSSEEGQKAYGLTSAELDNIREAVGRIRSNNNNFEWDITMLDGFEVLQHITHFGSKALQKLVLDKDPLFERQMARLYQARMNALNHLSQKFKSWSEELSQVESKMLATEQGVRDQIEQLKMDIKQLEQPQPHQDVIGGGQIRTKKSWRGIN